MLFDSSDLPPRSGSSEFEAGRRRPRNASAAPDRETVTHSIGFNASVDSFPAEKTAPSCDRVGAGMLMHQDLNHEALAAWATHGLSRLAFRVRKHWPHLL